MRFESDVKAETFVDLKIFLLDLEVEHFTEIENIYIDTKRWSTTRKVYNGRTASGKTKFKQKTVNHVSYDLNIVGTFGSAKLNFNDRQKRDEVRNALQQTAKKLFGKNIDRKVSEFN